ncbi:MAG: translocation/assembly module TamB domain-containing protein [Methylotenera sp.]|uniref:translocation/assembly module TamB domain-containing protein n=1 Tax=Methylotenera sp. TaxID=2051956 RepID=UPI0024878654|nr:translocation/assembly module TamB domain-containing protein [Methylotenera sp.]MDI1309889.1 translocation/assembly module TamB domain-containing protein [Methylotenera sp.]
MLQRYFSTRYLMLMLIGLTLLVSSAHSAMSINSQTSLDTFSYDLDNIHLKLEKLDANWQFSPFGDGKLLVDKVRAKRLIITVGDGTAKTKDAGLPEKIKPPFPIQIKQAEIAEVLVIKNGETQTFSHLKLNLEADAKTIKINSLTAGTPWGEVETTLEMSTTKPFLLNGLASLKKTDAGTPYDVAIELAGDLETLHFDSNLVLANLNNQLAILQTQQANAPLVALVNIKGQLGLTNDYPLSANIAINELRSENFGSYPAAKLNFDIAVQGKLLPTFATNIQFAARDSQWQDQAFISSGKIIIDDKQIRNIDLQASIANNIIKANGSLGQADSKLDWQADLAELRKFGAGYSGQANVSGTVTGTFENLALQLKLLANNISLPSGLKVEKLAGQASIMADENGQVNGEFTASNLQYNKHPVMDGKLTLQGTRTKHQLNLTAQSKDKEFKFESTLQGGLITATNRWQGLLQNLTLEGTSPIKLTAPAPLSFDTKGATLEQAHIKLNKGNVFVDLMKFDSNGFASTGHADQLALEDLPAEFFILPSTLQGSPVFSAKWDIKATDSLNGNFNIWHDAGDFTLTTPDGTKKPLGLQEAKFDAKFVNNQAEISTSLKGQNIGLLEANLSTTFTKVNAGFALLANAPLTLNGKAQLQTLAWLPMPPSLMDANFDGHLNINVSANGTLAEPNLNGSVDGKDLQFSLPTEGVNFSNGELQASFEHNKLLITKATWQGGDGHLQTTGFLLLNTASLDKSKPQIDLDWSAQNFTALSRTDRLLTLNGTGKTTLTNGLLMITGNFNVAKGLVELSNEDTPVLGDDVVIIGQTDSTPEPALKILLNGLRIDLGNDFTLRGRGLDAKLSGALTLTGLTQYQPHTEGIIEVKEGSFSAYGQKLIIERGIINFNGTVGNPGINIRAMRNSTPVNAGIEVTGTALIPITKLVSDPNVTDSEKLSWLVLGHGMDQTPKSDYGLLSLAAGVLLSQGDSVPLQTKLARAAGLDEFGFSGGDADSAAVVFGKRLSSRLYLSYQKSISGLLDVARLTYNMTSRWSLRGEAGTESAVDVLYTFSFK